MFKARIIASAIKKLEPYIDQTVETYGIDNRYPSILVYSKLPLMSVRYRTRNLSWLSATVCQQTEGRCLICLNVD